MDIIEYKADNNKINKILNRNLYINKKTVKKVKKIVADVKMHGDSALFKYTKKFDRVNINSDNIMIKKDFFDKCRAQVEPKLLAALNQAKKNIENFHRQQKQSSWLKKFDHGVKLGQRILPLGKAGVYVPGGKAFYPSSCLMNIIPAQIAGVEQIIVTTPPAGFRQNPVIGATLSLLGINQVYLAGGAQAIAALAFGTESIPQADKIVGPGNIFVALAKREVYGQVDIDMIAGPSEIVVLADQTANAEWVALDLLSQAEHGSGLESAILITDSSELARSTQEYIASYLEQSEKALAIKKILSDFGAIIMVKDIEQGALLVNRIAPEHLEIMVKDNEQALSFIKNAGAIFVGAYSSEPVGDYWAGPNHVLPTSGTARFFSPLGVYDFVKKSSLIYYTREGIRKNAQQINIIAECEKLDFHGKAVIKRYEDLKKG